MSMRCTCEYSTRLCAVGTATRPSWRALITYREGGVYADADTRLRRPLREIIRPSDDALSLLAELPDDDGGFAWMDDSPTRAELDWLRARGWLDRWLWVDTREEPEDLLRAQDWLAQRLARAAKAAEG